ncbi:cytochrome b561 and DOMON domain-containing protein At5g47530-like [Curcuma longa]|uniref:cytochrome b561 and DOMON domain-containing protein At5g47530-like n=1 Tax=Curcuma longa TaxID=136217 RepID=UPI003D9E6EF4
MKLIPILFVILPRPGFLKPSSSIPLQASAMELAVLFLVVFSSSSSLLLHATAQRCDDAITSSDGKLYTACNVLPYHSASLHWNYHASNGTVDIAYRASGSSSSWVAWAINPNSTGMVGANAFLAFTNRSTGIVVVFATRFASTNVQVADVRDEELAFPVHEKRAEYSSGYYTIYASLELPGSNTRQNTVWQASSSFRDGVPYGHPLDAAGMASMSTLDFLSGQTASGGGNSRLHRKNIHGVINAISWGILLPTGAILARYVKVFQSADPAWFYLHVACQCSAYVVGLAGWILGLKLGSESKGITYHKHRDIGIALFCLATVQVFALFLRPDKDHKYRWYWNLYHYAVGYAVIILSIVNIFEGFDILDPAKKWKDAYIAVIATLGGVALVLEAVTWAMVTRRRSSEKPHHGGNTANGVYA